MSKEEIKDEELNAEATEQSQANVDSVEEAEASNEASADTEESGLSELEQKDAEIKELNDKFLRLYSEFDNFRRRTAKEKIDIISTASADVLKELLTVVDDFERAIDNNAKVEDPEALKEGFQLIYNKTMGILKNKGLEPMDSQGETFDVDKHEALTQIPAPSEDMKGKVVDVVEKGYVMKEKVIRFAKVVVGN